MINKRQKKILLSLLKDSSYVTTSDIANLVDVTERTIHNDLNEINDFIDENNSELTFDRKKGVGILICGSQVEKNKIIELLNDEKTVKSDNKEIEEILLFKLLNSKNGISLDELAEELFISKTTLHKLMNNAQKVFAENSLQIISKPRIGTFVTGSERKKRKLLAELLRNIQKDTKIKSLSDFFDQERMAYIQRIIQDVFHQHQLEVPQELSSIDIHIYFMLERMIIQKNVALSDDERQAVSGSLAQTISSQILAQLVDVYPINYSSDEIDYLALRIESVFSRNQKDSKYYNEAEILSNKIIDSIDDALGYSLQHDVVLHENLVEHLSSAYFRISHNMPIHNPLANNIFRTYTQLFLCVQMVFEDYYSDRKIALSQDELAYITIHLQSAIERFNKQKSKVFKTILVTDNSNSMATFLEARINREIPDLNVVELVQFDDSIANIKLNNIDFIITTVPFKNDHVVVLNISPMFAENDILEIKKFMLEHEPKETKKFFDFAKFTSPFLVYPNLDCDNFFDVIKLMNKLLVKNNYVNEEFVSSVIEREKLNSTKVANLVSLPHGNTEYVNQSTISIATLKNPIESHGDSIRLIILLAIKKEEIKNAEFKKIFSVIHYLEKKPERVEKILSTNDPLEVIRLLSEYE